MALNIRNLTRALRDRLARLRRERTQRRLADELDEIAQQCARLPVRDGRTADEILGYDENGPPDIARVEIPPRP